MSGNFFHISKGIALEPQLSAPSSPSNGDLYYDSVANQFKFYQNGSWTAGVGSASVITSASDPTINDDSGDGYTVGTLWVNTTSDTAYYLEDATLGAAVWTFLDKAHRDATAAHGATGAVVGTTNTQTLTNKTLTAPVINSPTGITKSDVGLGNVDNTSDATKNAAAVTLTNKTLTSPVINSPTGIVKGDVGLGNVDNTSDATKNSAVATLTNKTLTSPLLTTPSTDVIDLTQQTTPSNPASGHNKIYTKSNDKLYLLNSAGTETEVGSGAGSLNTIFQLKGDDGVSGWATGDNATFLGGGTISGTFAQNSSSPLHGSFDFKYTQAAGSLDDYFASPVQTVDPKFRGNTVFLTFNYKYDGGNSDILAIIYDVTNSQIISATTDFISLNSTIASTFVSSATIPSNCTQIRVGFHVKALNSGKIFQFDDIQVGQDLYPAISLATQNPFVQLRTGNGHGSTNTKIRRFSNLVGSYGSDVTYTDSSTAGAAFTINTAGTYAITYSDCFSSASYFGLSRNSTQLTTNIYDISATTILDSTAFGDNLPGVVSWCGPLVVGDVIRAHTAGSSNGSGGAGVEAKFVITRIGASNPTIAMATEQFSTDTASLVYAGSGTYTLSTLANAPIGTFLTFTRSSSSNTRTQTSSAPSQSVSSMNTNGIQIFTRAFAAADSSGSPACFAIQIGKNLKGIKIDGYDSVAKANSLQIDKTILSSNVSEYGLDVMYDEVRGILFLDAGRCSSASVTDRGFMSPGDTGTNNPVTSGYFVINAGKTPALTAIPTLQQRTAVIRDEKSSGTHGGTFTSGSFQTRTLNTLEDPYGIVPLLSSNQFTLYAGTYLIEALAPADAVENHKTRIRNITDSTDAISGTSGDTVGGSGFITHSFCSGLVTIASTKVFELQHRCNSTATTSGFGEASGYSVNEVYSVVKITKIK